MTKQLLMILAACALHLGLAGSAHACEREHTSFSGTTNSNWTIDNRGCGVMTLQPSDSDRRVSMTCQALSMREGHNDKWLSLEISSPDLPQLDFYDKQGVDNVTRITSTERTATVRAGRTARVFVDHRNNQSLAMELSCRIRITNT